MSRAYIPTAPVTAVDAADPNTTGPNNNRIFRLGKRGAGDYAQGVAFIPVFTGGTTPTVSITLWQLDGNSGGWVVLGTFATLAPTDRNVVKDIRADDSIFAQVTAIAGSPTNVAIAFQTI